MDLSLIHLSVVIMLSTASPDPTPYTLQIFSGTLTEVTCSAAQPGFYLMNQEREYDSRSYAELPDLFDIEVRAFSNRDNVTLYISGTNRSNNVTIMCSDLTNFGTGQVETLFTLLLEFFGILPAPRNVYVRYSSQTPGQLHVQIMWEPPDLFTDHLNSQNVSIDSRITHYILFITMEKSVTTNYTTFGIQTSFTFELNNTSCSLSFQVAAVNPVGMGERSPSEFVEWCMDYTSSSTHINMNMEPSKNNLSTGEIAAIICTVVLVFIITASVLIAAVFIKGIYLKSKRCSSVVPDPHHLENTLQDKKQTQCGQCSSGDIDVNNQPSESATTHKKYARGGPLIYAEVVPKMQMQVAEPSSVEKLSYAVIEHPSQINADSEVQGE